jgi:hypothetical protein
MDRAEEVTEVTTSIGRNRRATSVTKVVHKTRLTVAAALAIAVGAIVLAVSASRARMPAARSSPSTPP